MFGGGTASGLASVRWGLRVVTRRYVSRKPPESFREDLMESWSKTKRLLDFASRGAKIPSSELQASGPGYLWLGRNIAAWPVTTMPLSEEEVFRSLSHEEAEKEKKKKAGTIREGEPGDERQSNGSTVEVQPEYDPESGTHSKPPMLDGQELDPRAVPTEEKSPERMEMRRLKNARVRQLREQVHKQRRAKEVRRILQEQLFPKPRRKAKHTVVVPDRKRDE